MNIPQEAVEAIANHRMDRIELMHDENTGEYRLAPSTASEDCWTWSDEEEEVRAHEAHPKEAIHD